MLYKLIALNRDQLIRRCIAKQANRFAPAGIPSTFNCGVPLFLQQLVDTLHRETLTPDRDPGDPEPHNPLTSMSRAAALQGEEMLRLGFSIEQVVHNYGDVCQAVTDMAVEQNAIIFPDEFRTLNRCVDNAIASAVTVFERARPIRVLRTPQHDENNPAMTSSPDALRDHAIRKSFSNQNTRGRIHDMANSSHEIRGINRE